MKVLILALFAMGSSFQWAHADVKATAFSCAHKNETTGYSAEVSTNRDWQSFLVVKHAGKVITSESVTTGTNGDTFAWAKGTNLTFIMDLEDESSGRLEFKDPSSQTIYFNFDECGDIEFID